MSNPHWTTEDSVKMINLICTEIHVKRRLERIVETNSFRRIDNSLRRYQQTKLEHQQEILYRLKLQSLGLYLISKMIYPILDWWKRKRLYALWLSNRFCYYLNPWYQGVPQVQNPSEISYNW